MKIPKDIILPQPQDIIDLESTIKATKLLATTLDELYRLLYGDIDTISSGKIIQSNTFRSAEGSGNSTVITSQLRLAVSGRAPNYWGNSASKIIKTEYYGVIGIKSDGTNTVTGKIRFSGMNGEFVDGPSHTNDTTGWLYWYDKVEIPISGLYLNGVDGGAYQSGVLISATAGTNYYYSGFSELMIYLNA